MKAVVRDKAAFEALNHRDVLAYLVGQGWRERGHLTDRAHILFHEGAVGEEWEVLVPARRSVGDYAARMAEIVNVLSNAEARSELEILADLGSAGTDVVRIRVVEAGNGGSIAVDAGVALHEQARQLLLAAACAAYQPRAAFHAGKVTEAVEYLSAVRFGPSERGSYVLTLLSPVDPAIYDQQGLFPELEDDPFPRRVTRVLASALQHLQQSLVSFDTGEGFAAFERSVEQGISANLCEAVAGLVERGGAEIGLTWARTRPSPAANVRAHFTPDTAGVLREVAREFRRRTPRPDTSLVGFVVRLARDPDLFDGEATLTVIIEGERRPRNVRVTFNPDDYDKVIEAFRTKTMVGLDGDIVFVGNRLEVRNPRGLQLHAATEPGGPTIAVV